MTTDPNMLGSFRKLLLKLDASHAIWDYPLYGLVFNSLSFNICKAIIQ